MRIYRILLRERGSEGWNRTSADAVTVRCTTVVLPRNDGAEGRSRTDICCLRHSRPTVGRQPHVEPRARIELAMTGFVDRRLSAWRSGHAGGAALESASSPFQSDARPSQLTSHGGTRQDRPVTRSTNCVQFSKNIGMRRVLWLLPPRPALSRTASPVLQTGP